MKTQSEIMSAILESYNRFIKNNIASDKIVKFLLPLERLSASILDESIKPPEITKRWIQQTPMLHEPKALTWLETAGGLTLANIENETDLMYMAHTAPNDLLFGLAYGAYADLLVWDFEEWNEIHRVQGKQHKLEDNYLRCQIGKQVLAHGRELWERTNLEWMKETFDFNHDDYVSNSFNSGVILPYSKTPMDILMERALFAITPFALGLFTSWLFLAFEYQHYPISILPESWKKVPIQQSRKH